MGVILHCQPNLLEIILAAHPPPRFACRLDRRQQKSDQDADDRDHHQKFHQRKPTWPRLSETRSSLMQTSLSETRIRVSERRGHVGIFRHTMARSMVRLPSAHP